MTCKAFGQFASIAALAVIFTACSGPKDSGAIEGSGAYSIRNGVDVKTPAEGKNQHNMANYAVMVFTTSGGGMCTGSLIARDIVITAAHCVSYAESAADITVAFGLKNAPEGISKVSQAKDFLMHEDYNVKSNAGGNDLALIRLSEPAPKEFIVLELPDRIDLPSRMTVNAVGYGTSHGRYENEETAGVLRTTDITIHVLYAPSQILSFDQSRSGGICQGDSGGPAIYHYIGRKYLVGVAKEVQPQLTQYQRVQLAEMNFDWSLFRARNPGFDLCETKGAYTNVKVYVNWIKSAMTKLM